MSTLDSSGGELDSGPWSTLNLKIKKQISDPSSLQGLRKEQDESIYKESKKDFK